MDTRLQRGFRVGEYDVRPLEGRIIGPTGSQHVQPKVMEVLVCLAEHAGDLVEREVLLAQVWGDGAGSDEVLTRCISELRHHLGDHHDSVQYIQTVPKRGYRLVAVVTITDAQESVPGAPVSDPTTSKRPTIIAAFWEDLKRRNVVRVSIAYIVVGWLLLQVGETIFDALNLPDWSLTLLLALIVIGFPVAVILAWIFQVTPEGVVVDVPGASAGTIALRRNLDILIIGSLVIAVAVLSYRVIDDGDEPPRPPGVAIAEKSQLASIAVLRFLNIGGVPYFADGLGEELLDRLAKLNELGVAARTSSWAFANSDVDVPTIAAQLKVDYVLEGSVRQSGDRIRITAQLNDGKTGKHVWSQSYDRELTTENFFETQSEIARQVVNLLKVSLSPESEEFIDARPHTSMQALDYYLQGQEYFRQPHSDATLDAAAKLFNRSLEVDPRFAMAYAGLCDAELGRYIIARDVEVFQRAEAACLRAHTLDEDIPRVQAALGGLYLFSGQNEKAEETLTKAITDSPNLIESYADLGEAIENQGRIDEAEQVLMSMIARQPGYWYGHNALGNFLYRQSRYEEAERAFSTVTELVPNRALGYNNVGIANYMMGNFEAASKAYEMSVKLEPYVDNYTNLGLAYFYEGRYDEAAEMQERAYELRPDKARVLGRLATAYHFAGRKDDAKVLFGTAIEMINEQLVVNPKDIRLNRALAVYNVTIGLFEEAQQAIERALELQPESSGVRYDAAKVALLTRDVEAALEYLRKARELGYSRHIMRSDPVFESLHDNPGFQEIVKENNEE